MHSKKAEHRMAYFPGFMQKPAPCMAAVDVYLMAKAKCMIMR